MTKGFMHFTKHAPTGCSGSPKSWASAYHRLGVFCEVHKPLDECLGKPMMEKLAATLSASPHEPHLKHMRDFQEEGVLDSVWIPQIRNEGYVVITADRGKHKNKGGKLPLICQTYGVTQIGISTTIINGGNFGQMQAIIETWNDIVATASAPAGSRYSLRMAGSAGHAKLVLMPPIKPPAAKRETSRNPKADDESTSKDAGAHD